MGGSRALGYSWERGARKGSILLIYVIYAMWWVGRCFWWGCDIKTLAVLATIAALTLPRSMIGGRLSWGCSIGHLGAIPVHSVGLSLSIVQFEFYIIHNARGHELSPDH